MGGPTSNLLRRRTGAPVPVCCRLSLRDRLRSNLRSVAEHPIRATVRVLALMVNVLCMGRLVSRLVLDHPTSWFDREATISSSRLILVGRYAVAVEGGRTPFRSDLSLMATNTAAHLLDRESQFVLIVRWLDGLAGNYAHVCGRRGRFHRSNAAF